MNPRCAIFEFDEDKPFSNMLVIMNVADMVDNTTPDRMEVFVKPAHPTLMPSGQLGVVFERESYDAEDQVSYIYTLAPNAFVRPDEGGFWVTPIAFTSEWVQKQGLVYALFIQVQNPTRLPLGNARLLHDAGIWVDKGD